MLVAIGDSVSDLVCSDNREDGEDEDDEEIEQGKLSKDDETSCVHQQKILPSGQNGSVRVEALRLSRQRHPGSGLLHAWHQYHASCCILLSNRRFTISSRSVGLLF
jgi:hypothetical protein